jgi:hypothetical protein
MLRMWAAASLGTVTLTNTLVDNDCAGAMLSGGVNPAACGNILESRRRFCDGVDNA